jgi:4-amino-4-deoxy-L-arabinose transferase-like glycosyltransferase
MNPQLEARLQPFRSLKGWAVMFVGTCLGSFTIFLLYANLGHYDDLYDSGVYLESARMMLRGGHLYTTIFDSQPPLWLPLVYGSMRLFGMTFLAGQMLTATTGLIVVITTGLIARELSDWPGAWAAVAIVVLSPIELQWSRAVSPEVPASAFAVVGMAFAMRYIRSGSHGALALSSGLIAASVLVKLLGLFTLPALFLATGLRCWKTSSHDRRIWLPMVVDITLAIATFSAVIICAFISFDPARVWHQAVEFHWAARSAIAVDAMPRTSTLLAQLLAHDWLLVGALLFAIVGLVSIPEGIVLMGWIAFTLAGLLFHRPLFSHHLVVVIPPIAIAAGAGWSRFWQSLCGWVDRAQRQPGRRVFTTSSLAIVAGISLTFGLSAVAVRQALRQVHSILQVVPDTADLKSAELIVHLTAEDAAILTDAQGIAFAAGRDVPPQLSDTSLVRIASGYLTAGEVVRAAEQSNVQLFLLWTGRLALLPGVVEWAARRFPYRIPLGKGRELYSMRPLVRTG